MGPFRWYACTLSHIIDKMLFHYTFWDQTSQIENKTPNCRKYFITDDRNYLYCEILEICLFPVDGSVDNHRFPFLVLRSLR